MFTNDIKLVASINNGMLPKEVINKMKMELKNKEIPKEPENDIEAEKAKLLMELDLI